MSSNRCRRTIRRASRLAFSFALSVLLVTGGLFVQPVGGTADPIALTQPAALPAGDGWIWQNPLPQGTDLNDTHFVDESTGWAVGGAGTILKTTDGGATWQDRSYDGRAWLQSVWFDDEDTGWAVGAFGTVISTTDGGETWSVQTLGADVYLIGVHFVNEHSGWAVGGSEAVGGGDVILATTDGGATWHDRSHGGDHWLEGVWFADEDTGWAVGGTTILKTTDGGVSWAPQSSGTTEYVRSVYFVDANAGWAVAGDTILKTVDGGANWVEHDVSDRAQNLKSIRFVDEDNGVAVGGSGDILTTSDGGSTWTARDSRTLDWLYAVHFADADNGWVVGAAGRIVKTTDGGSSWSSVSFSAFGDYSQALLSIRFVDAMTGWAVGHYGTILKTTDGGMTWVPQTGPTVNGLNSVSFVDQHTGCAVGASGNVFYTTDGGETWSQSAPTMIASTLRSVWLVDASIGWAVGNSGKVLKTTDGGATWALQDLGTASHLHAVLFVDSNTGWIADQDGNIRKTTDGGASWTLQTSGTSERLLSLSFIDANTGWASGYAGTILKTTNGGTTWVEQDSEWLDPLHEIHFADADNGWAVGQDNTDWGGVILRTTDGGLTWTRQARLGLWPFSVHSFGTERVWVCGGNGSILRYAPNVAPVAVNDSYTTPYGTALTVPAPGVLENDTDADGDVLVAVKATDPAHGTLTLATNGGFTYTPATGFSGTDTFTYRANDGEADSNVATVSISVGSSTAIRLSDRTRFSTAIAIAKAGYPAWAGVKHVVIASGDDRAAADPLSASGLCWAYDAPMLLVSAARTPDEVKAAMKQITDANGTVTLHVVGGPVSVPDARLAELVAAGGGPGKVKLDRLLSTGGRYDMAAAIASRMKAVRGAEMPSVALIANGADATKFFDALALSPIAAGKGAPILLVTADSVPTATQNALNSLKPATKIVGGGPNTVSEKVRVQLGATRWSGRTRYDTAIAIANGAVSKGWLTRANVGIAAKLPDALTGGSLVGAKGGVLLLTDGATLTPVTQGWLTTYKAQVSAVWVFGGPLSITENVMTQIRNAIK